MQQCTQVKNNNIIIKEILVIKEHSYLLLQVLCKSHALQVKPLSIFLTFYHIIICLQHVTCTKSFNNEKKGAISQFG